MLLDWLGAAVLSFDALIVIVGIEGSSPESLVRLFLYTSVIKIRISSAALRNGQSSTPTGRLISRKRNTKDTTKK